MRYVWILLFAIAASCNNTDHSTATPTGTTDSTTPITSVKTIDTVCYLAMKNRDSILLQLFITDSLVTGRMQYDNFGMDGNMGTVQGVQRGNRIEGYFRFFAEGMWSVREIVFEQQGEQLRQAKTDSLMYTGDTARFKNKAAVAFEQDRVFQKWNCNRLRFDTLPQ